MRAALSLTVFLLTIAAKPPPPELSRWVAGDPFRKIGGYTFLTHPYVRAAVEKAVYSETVRRRALSDELLTSGIVQSGRLTLLPACEPHYCAGLNWAIVVARPRGPAAVCYHEEALTDGESRWFIGGELVFKTTVACDETTVPAAIVSALTNSSPS